MMKSTSVETSAFTHEDIKKQFKRLINWAKGGSLYIITPFINELDIGKKRDLTAELHRQARATMDIRLMVAPPKPPHPPNKHKDLKSLLDCGYCKKAAKKIRLLDKYWTFAVDLLIKETLHGKVYLASNASGELRCLTGSVNLTKQAFEQWCELGITTSDQQLVNQICRIITLWEGPDRKRGGRALPYPIWKRDFFRNYPHLPTILDHL